MPFSQLNNSKEDIELHRALAMLNEPTKRRIALILFNGQSNPASLTRSILRRENITNGEYQNIHSAHITKMVKANMISKMQKLNGTKYQEYCITPLGALALERKGLIKKNLTQSSEYV
jgi:hypothetical protein